MKLYFRSVLLDYNGSMADIVVELAGQDRIEVNLNPFSISVIGCTEVLKLFNDYHKKHGGGLSEWPLPTGRGHAELLLKETILKVRGEWKYPYEHQELCHCRAVLTDIVDQAILRGAHTTAEVSRKTTASTSCGTCRPDVEKILNYRLK